MNVSVLPRGRNVLGSTLMAALWLSQALVAEAGEQQIVLRDYIQQEWTNELLTYPFSAPEGACQPESVTLAGPQGPLPVQLSDIELWPGSQRVKSAKVSFIANLAPLATDRYTVSYGHKPATARAAATDLTVTPGEDQVESTTRGFGVRLLQGEKTYGEPAAAKDVPGPVFVMRLADGTWFGGSRMFGPGKIASCSAKLVDRGPVFARVAFRYTYADGNTLDLTVQVAAGDNALRMEIGDQNISPVRRPEGDSIGCYNSPVSGPLFQDTGRLAVLGVV